MYLSLSGRVHKIHDIEMHYLLLPPVFFVYLSVSPTHNHQPADDNFPYIKGAKNIRAITPFGGQITAVIVLVITIISLMPFPGAGRANQDQKGT